MINLSDRKPKYRRSLKGEPQKYGNVEMSASEYEVVSLIGKFPEIVKSAGEKYEPSLVTRYAIDLATAFNKFYIDCKIAVPEEDVKNFRLSIAKAVKITPKISIGSAFCIIRVCKSSSAP